MYIDKNTLKRALEALYGTAGHLLKIWFTLKHMGMSVEAPPVEIDTKNSTPALERLFSCGHPLGYFYVPFAHTQRYLTMKGDASRSIIQTTIRRWISSDSVFTCNPSSYIDMEERSNGKLFVSTGRRYPEGLGFSENGFAINPTIGYKFHFKPFQYGTDVKLLYRTKSRLKYSL